MPKGNQVVLVESFVTVGLPIAHKPVMTAPARELFTASWHLPKLDDVEAILVVGGLLSGLAGFITWCLLNYAV